MANLRDIRRRIKSVKNTAQITKAMQMVASAKMRKAQQAALSGRPYALLMNEVLAAATAGAGEFSHPLMEQREVKKRGVILISSDKGLCGALAGFFRLGLIDVLGADRHVGEDGDAVAGDLHEAVADGEEVILSALARSDLARDHLGHERDVHRIDAHLALDPRESDHVHILRVDLGFGGDDFELDRGHCDVGSMDASDGRIARPSPSVIP